MSGQELTCKEVVEIVSDYLEDALSARDRARFEAHLAGCAGCTTYVEQMREIVPLTGMLTEEQVPAEHRERLRQAFRDWKAS